MGVKRTAIVRNSYKDASYLMFGGSGGSGGYSGIGGAGANIQLAMQKEKDRKKQEVKEQLREYKRQLEMKEEIRKQEAKIEAEIKQDQMQRNMIDPRVMNVHTRKIPDSRERIFLCDMIETNPKEENIIIKIIKNFGKKKPPKNMTIVQ
jgi:hypothetical protein